MGLSIQLKVKKVHAHAQLPTKTYCDDSCFDLYSVEDKVVPVGQWAEVESGVIVECPAGYGIHIRPRSSYGKRGLIVHPGTVDNGYRGQLTVFVLNTTNAPYTIKQGDRVAQMFIEQIAEAHIIEVDEVSQSDRGARGFGSSGR